MGVFLCFFGGGWGMCVLVFVIIELFFLNANIILIAELNNKVIVIIVFLGITDHEDSS